MGTLQQQQKANDIELNSALHHAFSGMSIDESETAEKKTMSDQQDDDCKMKVNNECERLLKLWGLSSICGKLHEQGWSDPNECINFRFMCWSTRWSQQARGASIYGTIYTNDQ